MRRRRSCATARARRRGASRSTSITRIGTPRWSRGHFRPTRVHALHREMARIYAAPMRCGSAFADQGTIRAGRQTHRRTPAATISRSRLSPSRRRYALHSVRDLWLRTGLSPRIIERLADADAFGSLGLSRRQALWAAKALGRVGDRDDDLPLLRASDERTSHSSNIGTIRLMLRISIEIAGIDTAPEPEVTFRSWARRRSRARLSRSRIIAARTSRFVPAQPISGAGIHSQ